MISDETFPIGVFSSTAYADQSIQLREGDIIIMYTDGLIETMGNMLEVFDSIREFLLNCNTKNPVQLGKQLLEFCIDERTVRDDISVLVGSIWKNI
jgi:serine phosphatase RsbU (regulator of sigma subunit)